jgi:hypothetical protein
MTTNQIIVNILCSIVGSFIFLFLVLILFKPKILISPFVTKGKFSKSDPNEYYFIKIINISLFSAYDVKVELLQIDYYPAGTNQMNTRHISLTLVEGSIRKIPGYRPSWLRKNAPYAVKVRTTENLEQILSQDSQAVAVKVSLRHGLTGLVKVGSKEYYDVSQVKVGKFAYGLKFGPL